MLHMLEFYVFACVEWWCVGIASIKGLFWVSILCDNQYGINTSRWLLECVKNRLVLFEYFYAKNLIKFIPDVLVYVDMSNG